MSKKRVYISDKAYIKLKEMTRENKDKLNRNRGMCGMLDILILGEVTSEGSGRPKKLQLRVNIDVEFALVGFAFLADLAFANVFYTLFC